MKIHTECVCTCTPTHTHTLCHTLAHSFSPIGGVFHSSDVWASFVQFRWMTEIIYHSPYVRLFLSQRKSMQASCGSQKNCPICGSGLSFYWCERLKLLIDNKSRWGLSVSLKETRTNCWRTYWLSLLPLCVREASLSLRGGHSCNA